MKIWIDDLRPAPLGYVWVKTINQAKEAIIETETRKLNSMYDMSFSIELIDIDHNAGDFACDGGDYVKLLDWLEETKRNYPIHIHSMNPVGIENMRRIIQKNGWVEIK